VVSLARIDTQPNGQIDGLVELGLCGLWEKGKRVLDSVPNGRIDEGAHGGITLAYLCHLRFLAIHLCRQAGIARSGPGSSGFPSPGLPERPG